jgi:site-specific DNA recombinase
MCCNVVREIGTGESTMRAAAYIRVSSTEQIQGTSLEVQEDQAIAYCALKGLSLVGVFSDPGVSGSVPLVHRPSGKKLVNLIDRGEVDCVILAKLDRGFRSASDCLVTLEHWQKQGVALHIIDLGGNSVDSKSPAGKFMLSVLAAAAEMERGMIQARCNAGREARRAVNGRIGEIPFGWTVVADGKTLVENPEEQEAIMLVRSMHHDGHSLRAIATELVRRGIPSKKGGSWSHKQVASLLQRKVA